MELGTLFKLIFSDTEATLVFCGAAAFVAFNFIVLFATLANKGK